MKHQMIIKYYVFVVFLGLFSRVAAEVISVQANRPFLIYKAGESSDVVVAVSDLSDRKLTFSYSVTGPFGDEVSGGVLSNGFFAGQSVEFPLPIDTASFGPREIHFRLMDGTQFVCEKIVKYTVVPENNTEWHAGDFIFGVQAQLYWYITNPNGWAGVTDMEALVCAARDLGVTHVRSMIAWQRFEENEGVYEWGPIDELFGLFKKYDLRQCNTFGFTPEWSSKRLDPKRKYAIKNPPYLPDYIKYVQDFTRRYRDQIQIYEVWNEPNWTFWGGPVDEYIDLANAVYPILKKEAPEDSIIIVGGYSQRHYHDKIQAIINGTADVYSHAAFHLHDNYDVAVEHYNALMKIFEQGGYQKAQLLNTESGMHAIVDRFEPNQAVGFIQKTALQFSQGIMGVFSFDLLDNPFGKNAWNSTFGLIGIDHAAKPVYSAYAAMIHLLSGAKPVTELDPFASISHAQFQRGGDRVVILWNNDPHSIKTVWLKGAAHEGTIYDFYANPIGTLASDNAHVAVGYYPMYVVFPETSGLVEVTNGGLKMDSTLLSSGSGFSSADVILPDDMAGCTLRLSSPVVEFQFPEIVLPPNAKAVQIGFSLPEGVNADRLCVELLKDGKVQEKVGGRVLRAPSIPLKADVKIDGSLKEWAESDQFLRRDSALDYVALLETMGGSRREPYTGALDLSADLYVAHDANSLYLACRVTDDLTVEPKNMDLNNLREADSLQIGLNGYGESSALVVRLALMNGEPVLGVVQTPGIPAVRVENELKYAVTHEGHETVYELKVPLQLVKKDGRALAVGAAVNDCDKNPGLRKGFMEFTGGVGDKQNPAQYHPFVLTE